ncbi:hypothetical protein BC828DRAFT_376741 [Blastocladiella britannica]|nr:hypothetical protein BC828DRAFT_376741 [Blastocladiella britannica]
MGVTATTVETARTAHRAGHYEKVLEILEPIVRADDPASGTAVAWPLYFAASAKLGRAATVADFFAAKDESLFPMLLLHRDTSQQLAVLAQVVPALTDLRWRQEAEDLFRALVARLPARKDVEALLATVDWLPDDVRATMLDKAARSEPPSMPALLPLSLPKGLLPNSSTSTSLSATAGGGNSWQTAVSTTAKTVQQWMTVNMPAPLVTFLARFWVWLKHEHMWVVLLAFLWVARRQAVVQRMGQLQAAARQLIGVL